MCRVSLGFRVWGVGFHYGLGFRVASGTELGMLPRDLAVLQLAEFFTEISRRPCVFKGYGRMGGPHHFKAKAPNIQHKSADQPMISMMHATDRLIGFSA